MSFFGVQPIGQVNQIVTEQAAPCINQTIKTLLTDINPHVRAIKAGYLAERSNTFLILGWVRLPGAAVLRRSYIFALLKSGGILKAANRQG